MKKETHPLLQLLVMAGLSLAMMLVVTLASVAVAGGALSGEGGTSALLWVQAVTQVCTFLLPVVAVTWLYHRDEAREYCRLDFGGPKWVMGAVGVVVLVLLMPLVDWLTVWNDGWHWSGAWARVEEALRAAGEASEQLLGQFLDATSVGSLVVNLVVIALIPAVCEEVFFRAGVQNLLQRWFRNPHAAIWATAAIFSLAHGEVFAFLPRFALGALLGYLYVFSGSIVANVLTHFANNAIIVVLYWLSARGIVAMAPDEPLMLDATLTACCAVAAVGLMYVTFSNRLKISR